MKNWLNKVWDTRKVLTNLFLMLNGHTCHRFVAWIWANESHPDRFIQLRTSVCKAPQTAKEGNQNVPRCSAGSSDVNVSTCHTSAFDCQRFIRKPFLIFRWNPLHHAEYLIANIVIGRFITFALYFNGKNGKKQIRRAEPFVSYSFQLTEAVRQHAGNRLCDSIWANDRLLVVWAGDLDFRVCRDNQRFTKESFQGFDCFCLLLSTVCMCAWIDCSLKIQFWNLHEISICFVLGEGPWFKTHIDTLISLNSRDISHIHHLSLIFSSLLDINVCSPPWLTMQGLLAFLNKSVPGLESVSNIFISVISVVLLVWGVGVCLASVCRHLVACDHVISCGQFAWEQIWALGENGQWMLTNVVPPCISWHEM